MIEYVLVCFVFGLAAALVAHGKARSSVGWFVTGALIGPFGLIVAALSSMSLMSSHESS